MADDLELDYELVFQITEELNSEGRLETIERSPYTGKDMIKEENIIGEA